MSDTHEGGETPRTDIACKSQPYETAYTRFKRVRNCSRTLERDNEALRKLLSASESRCAQLEKDQWAGAVCKAGEPVGYAALAEHNAELETVVAKMREALVGIDGDARHFFGSTCIESILTAVKSALSLTPEGIRDELAEAQKRVRELEAGILTRDNIQATHEANIANLRTQLRAERDGADRLAEAWDEYARMSRDAGKAATARMRARQLRELVHRARRVKEEQA